MRTSRKDCVVYVGELPEDVREREVEDLFWDVRFYRSLMTYETLAREPRELSWLSAAADGPTPAAAALRGLAKFGSISTICRVHWF
jgi:hypothetical protein